MKYKLLPSETVLEDDCLVHIGYVYIADLRIIESPIFGTVGELKTHFSPHVKEIRRCDLFDHEGMTTDDVFEV